MKIIFQNSKNKKYTTIDINPQASLESVRDELKSKHNFPDGAYTFIYKGKILRNPGPFNALQENTKVIVYIKPEEPKPPEGTAPQENPFNAQASPDQQEMARRAEQQRIDLITPILNSALNTNFMENLYNPENNFYEHPKEINEIRQMMDESTFALFSEFILRHFEVTLRSFNLTPDRILAIIGNSLPVRTRCITDFDASLMELSNEQRASFDRLRKLNYDPKITLDTFIACEYNEERTTECLEQIGK